MLVRASFGASLYTTAHEQHEWPPRVSGRAVRESKRKKQELKRNYTQSHFQRNFFKRRQARKKQCTYLSEAFAKQKTHKQHAHTKNERTDPGPALPLRISTMRKGAYLTTFGFLGV